MHKYRITFQLTAWSSGWFSSLFSEQEIKFSMFTSADNKNNDNETLRKYLKCNTFFGDVS